MLSGVKPPDRCFESFRAVLDIEWCRADELRTEGDHALNRSEQTQAAHVDELFALWGQMVRAEHDRNHAITVLTAHRVRA